jgi:hypothetical protein
MAPLSSRIVLTAGAAVLDVQILENQFVDVHVRLDGQWDDAKIT